MSAAEENGFEIDPRIAADTVFVTDWELSRVLLMDDARFPWLILVPRRAGLGELDDLSNAEQAALLHEVNRAMRRLRALAPACKTNLGALGNIVRQFHVHVVARREGDAAWPGPVWGSGRAQRYSAAERGAVIESLRDRHD